MGPCRIILADDSVMFRKGIAQIIQDKGHIVVGEADDGVELLDLLKTTSAELVIVSIAMPSLRGVEATREIKTSHPTTKVLILGVHQDQESLSEALYAGADGFLLRTDTDGDLLSAIAFLQRGEVYVSSAFSREIVVQIIDTRRKGLAYSSASLTLREKEVLKLVAEGKSSKEIGRLLYLSPRTIQRHRDNIKKKLRLKKSAELVRYAIQKGYVH